MSKIVATVSEMRCRGCPVRATALCGTPDGRLRAELARAGRSKRVAADTQVFAEDDRRYVAVVRRGVLRLQRTSRDGRRTIPAFVYPGEYAGALFRAGGDDCAVEAATAAELCLFERSTLERLLRQDRDLERRLMMAAADRLDRLLHLTWLLMSLRVEDRVAGYLLFTEVLAPEMVAPRSEAPDEVELPVGRRDLADHLGTSVETISRALHALERKGRIEILDPRRFRLLDRDGMEESTGLTPDVLAPLVRSDAEGEKSAEQIA